MIQTVEELEAIYGTTLVPSTTAKEVAYITPHYAALIAASPFVVLATCGPEGLDCSPRGDSPGFIKIIDSKTLVLADRRGNNRIDSLRNIVRDPRVALLFLIPGSGTTFRVNGRASISADSELLTSLTVEGKSPRTALIVTVEAAYFQCARAIVRSHLWDSAYHVDLEALPTPGAILAKLTAGEVGGRAYDEAWPGRAAQSLW